MYKSCPLKRSSTLVTLVCFSIAILSILFFNGMGRTIERGRLEQIRMMRIETSCYKLTSLLGTGRRGGSVATFDKIEAEIKASTKRLEDSSDTRALRESLGNFLQAAKLELRVIEERDFARAHLVDSYRVDPAYAPVSALLSGMVDRRGDAAKAWSQRIRLFSATILVAWALTVAALFSRYQAKIIALVRSEGEQTSARASELRFRSLVQNTADVIAVAAPDGTLVLVSEPVRRAWGRTPESLVGRSVCHIVHADDEEKLKDAVTSVLGGDEDRSPQVRILDGKGQYRPFRVFISDLTADPNVQGLLLTFHDLTERQAYEDELTYNAFHDRLTGLPNRSLFLDRLSQRMKSSDRDCHPYAVFFVDLDNFKVINDSLGHAAGDALLVAVSHRLAELIRPADTFARLGGDEFTILLNALASTEDAVEFAERIKQSLLIPISIAGREVFVTASIGIAMCDDLRCDASDMLRDADTAMYEAKGNGKSSFAVFDPTMNEYAVERLELECDLRTAVELGQLTVYYQPIVNMENGQIREFEALLRWNHPTRGLIPPLKFIPIAEETGLICEIGRWVLRESCRQLVQWELENPAVGGIDLSVNVSGKQFQQSDFVDQVCAILKETGLCPARLALEVTETAMLEDLSRMRLVLEKLRETGVRIAIDDFGTGYSSISYLARLPVDTLKIDRSFVSGLGLDDRADGLVKAIIAMARTLGMRVTSEGIETVGQYGALKNLGCDSGQGYLFAKPQPASLVYGLSTSSNEDEEQKQAA